MEHEVFVPVPAASLLSVLGDPARVARCVPSLQRDAGAPEALAGRLKFRVDGHTITYRGAVEVAATGPATVSVTGEGTAARGAGSVKVALTVTLDGSGTAGTAGGGASSGGEPGTTIRYAGTATADGRLVELDAEAVRAAARRLLDRFTQQLVTESLAAHGAPGAAGRESGATASADAPAAAPYGDADSSTGIEARADAETRPDGADADPSSDAPLPPDAGPSSDASLPPDAGPASGAVSGAVFDAPVPPASLDPAADIGFTVPDEPPAEAAHARRTMIGRSAEEVDHAPPRGRYAPVPSPETTSASSTLRWVAPAAALALASAVVVGRAWKRRR
ncbi:SRPBCC domain-containing protein [Streptomyces sp. NBC_01218]|uniref:SRPBCC domain-containing protein n=1 Tax=Streptomyces sp. NBC_01218 TaxID=2903780 RepID=UPI002E10488B|nr:SRPBCC domain-containing protein [Streptomyces sp. NBC_01218]